MKSGLLTFLISLFTLSLSAQKIPSEIYGDWEVWIPGAVTYLAKDDAVYRQYNPGSPMNKLSIKPDGAFQWGQHSGKLQKVNPWYAEAGRAYYRISDKKNNTYDFWYKKESDQLILLFGEVGGHAATGSRFPSSKEGSTQKQVSIASSGTGRTNRSDFKVDDHVMIEWSGAWYKGKILEVKDGRYKVHYDGWTSKYDEWVPASRLKY